MGANEIVQSMPGKGTSALGSVPSGRVGNGLCCPLSGSDIRGEIYFDIMAAGSVYVRHCGGRVRSQQSTACGPLRLSTVYCLADTGNHRADPLMGIPWYQAPGTSHQPLDKTALHIVLCPVSQQDSSYSVYLNCGFCASK